MRIDPLEWCFYTLVNSRTVREARELSKRIEAISAGAKTREFIKDAGVTGKVGEIVFDRFMAQYCCLSWKPMYDIIYESSGDICDFVVDGLQIDVKTRTLVTQVHRGGPHLPCDRSLHVDRFCMMISDGELVRHQDIYACCGYNPRTREGYVLGWAARSEVEKYEVVQDLKYPARCIPIGDLHQSKHLFDYVRKRNGIVYADPTIARVPAL